MTHAWSLAERHISPNELLSQVRAVATELVAERLLIAGDVERVIEYSGQRYDEVMAQGLITFGFAATSR